jgi:pimeloyl-ACP methyl ester carboxylesterase
MSMQVALVDGAITNVERWGTSGPAILCVHGMTSSRKSWTRLARRYGDRYRIFAYDQRGHGDSANVSGPMTLARAVEDMDTVLDAIGGAAVLIGHSWGGAVAIRAGLQTAVRAVVAVDPMIVQVPDAWYDEFIYELDDAFRAGGDEREANFRREYAHWHPDDVDGKVHAVAGMTTAPIRALRDDNPLATWDLRKDIAAYTKPLLLALAERSSSIVPQAILNEIEGYHTPDVTIQIFEGAGHNLHRTDFDAFAAALDEFLKDRQLA